MTAHRDHIDPLRAMILVASYNMRKAIGTDRRRRPERTVEVLNEIGADVVALQEADRRFGARLSAIPPDLLAAQSDYKPVPFDTREGSIGWHGNALLVRNHVEIVRHERLHLPSLEPRGAVLAELRVGVTSLRVVGMHLDLSGLWRRRQAQAILDYLGSLTETRPTILMGDLNEWSLAGGCLRDFGLGHRFAGCGKSFHTRRPVAALDRIMVSAELDILEAGTHTSETARRASDHFPIWARVRVSAARD